MKKLSIFLKTLLVAVGIGMGSSVWAYDIPNSCKIISLYIGTDNGNGTVSASTAPTITGWTSTIAGATASTTGTFSVSEIEEVTKPNITITNANRILGDAVGEGIKPTYVAGSTLQFQYSYSTSDAENTKAFATYTLNQALSSGKLIMSADFFQNGSTNNRPTVLNFLDSDGIIILSIYLQDGSSYQYFQYYYDGNTTAETDAYGRSQMRTYRGFGIYDLSIDVETGEVSFIIDAITRGNASGNDDRTRLTKSFIISNNIKDIKYVQVGTNNGNNRSTSYTIHLDNILLLTLNSYSNLYNSAKSEYDTKVENLDAAGQTYWAENVISAESITTEEEYNAAIAALPTTYIAAVKAQTTAGSDMSDAIPTGNAGWTCDQGNGPNSYLSTGATETYGTTSANKFTAGNIMSQTITGLPNGRYTVQFYGVVNAANNVSTVSGPNLVQAYANNKNLDIDVVLQNACTPTDYLRTLQANVEDGTLTYGLKAKDGVTDAGNWAVAMAYKVIYLGDIKYNYTINAVASGSTIKKLAEGSEREDNSYSIYIPKVIEKDSKFYVLNDESNTNLDRYYASYIMEDEEATQEIEYTLDESIVAYTEGVGSSYRNVVGSNNPAYSGGDYINNNAGSGLNKRNRGFDLGTLPTGTYQMVAFVVNSDNKRSVALRNIESESTASEPIIQITNSDKITGELTKNFMLEESTKLRVNGANSGTDKNNQMEEIDYVLIRKASVVYTIKYMCGGTEVKASDATRTAVWGTTISLTDADKANVSGTNKHYEYVSDDAASQVIAADGSTVITVYFKQVDEAYKWDFTGTTSDIEVTTGSDVIRENSTDCNAATAPASVVGLYLQENWKLYKHSTDDSYTGLRNISGGNRMCIIPSLKSGDKIVISGNADAINGIYGAKYEGTKDTDNNTYTFTMEADGNFYFDLPRNAFESKYYTIHSIVVNRELTEITAPIVSTTGYATLSSTYALDFTGIETLTAYKATTCDGTSVTLEPVTGTVAPNTGLVIKGVTTNIPVVATGDVQDGNLLLPCDGSWTTLNKSDTGTNYVLSEQGDPKVAVFAPIINTPATLRAGVAYLYVPSGSGSSRTLNIVFADDEATAVFDLNDKSEMINDKWYDLQGRRVDGSRLTVNGSRLNPGIYIKNGRKVVVK